MNIKDLTAVTEYYTLWRPVVCVYEVTRLYVYKCEDFSVKILEGQAINKVEKLMDVLLVYVFEGNVSLDIDGGEMSGAAGDVFLVGKGNNPVFTHISDNIKIMTAEFSMSYFRDINEVQEEMEIVPEYILHCLRGGGDEVGYFHFQFIDDGRIEGITTCVECALKKGRKRDEKIICTMLSSLALIVIDSNEHLYSQSYNCSNKTITNAIKHYVHVNYIDGTMAKAAKDTAMTLPTMSRFIKKHTGFTFKELLQARRFEVALEKFATTQDNINNIILEVGYENNSYFHRRFREKYNISPGEYREKIRRDKLR